MSYAAVSSHRSMALDRLRNDAYADALAAVVTPDTVVLDLGAGIGIHGLIAARLGARHVYLVEPEDVIAVAEEAVRANQLEAKVTCLQARIEDVTLPEQADVIVSAMTGNFLLSEDLLPVLFDARRRLLKPGGTLVPDRATMELVPVSAPKLYAREIEGWCEPQHAVTLGPARAYAANTLHFRWERSEVSYLADPQVIHRVELSTDDYVALHTSVEFRATRTDVCHGLAGWFTMRLGERWISTAPTADATHWSPAFLPLDPPVPIAAGDVLTVQIDRPPHGEWTWRVTTPAGAQRHSTMLGAPMKMATLRKAAADYAPSLNPQGETFAYILSRCDGRSALGEIAGDIQQRWPAWYRSRDEALRLVQSVVKQFA